VLRGDQDIGSDLDPRSLRREIREQRKWRGVPVVGREMMLADGDEVEPVLFRFRPLVGPPRDTTRRVNACRRACE
jgi:hypothetical protein